MAEQSMVPYEERNETPDVWRPVLTVAQIVNRQNAIAAVMHDAMKKDTHYGVIPGTRGKPSLLKAGAEMLTTFFGLSKSFTIMERVEDWTGEQHAGTPFFYYLIRCHLKRGDALIAEADGSCNSLESKYKWRTEWKNNVKTKILNDDVPSVVNTILKMAQKRALVAATLLAVGASDFFTQDVEDMAADYVDAEVRVIDPQPERPSPTPPPATPQADAPAPKNGNGTLSSIHRPWEPDMLIAKVRAGADRPFAGTHTDGAKGSTVGWLDEICGGKDRRITLLNALFGGPGAPVTSSKDLSESEWESLDIWRKVDASGLFRPNNARDIAVELCRDEANRVINAAIQAAAVGELPGMEGK